MFTVCLDWSGLLLLPCSLSVSQNFMFTVRSNCIIMQVIDVVLFRSSLILEKERARERDTASSTHRHRRLASIQAVL